MWLGCIEHFLGTITKINDHLGYYIQIKVYTPVKYLLSTEIDHFKQTIKTCAKNKLFLNTLIISYSLKFSLIYFLIGNPTTQTYDFFWRRPFPFLWLIVSLKKLYDPLKNIFLLPKCVMKFCVIDIFYCYIYWLFR